MGLNLSSSQKLCRCWSPGQKHRVAYLRDNNGKIDRKIERNKVYKIELVSRARRLAVISNTSFFSPSPTEFASFWIDHESIYLSQSPCPSSSPSSGLPSSLPAGLSPCLPIHSPHSSQSYLLEIQIHHVSSLFRMLQDLPHVLRPKTNVFNKALRDLSPHSPVKIFPSRGAIVIEWRQ